MSIQSIQNQAQNTELYQIHKKTEAQTTEQVQSEQAAQEVPQTDEYDKANPVGEEAEGIYSVSYDDDGSLKVDYKQPAAKSEGAGQAAGGTQAAETTDSDDDTEEEIEQLKQQRDQIKQQLNKEKDEETRKVLRTQLQAIEAQIAQKTAELKG